MFKQFKDIKARDEVKQEESALEKMIALGDEFVNNPEFRKINQDIFSMRRYIEKRLGSIKNSYDESDIATLIRLSSDLDDYYSKKIFGIYTGCLLSKLTDERHAEGKTTKIIVDRVKQDLMLLCTKNADTIIFSNCKGTYIGNLIGENGCVNQVIITNCEGNSLGSQIGYEGEVNQVIISNCTGDAIGYDIGDERGRVNQVIINDCKGNNLGNSINSYSTIGQVIINNCEGEEIGAEIGTRWSKLKQLIINKCLAYSIGQGIGRYCYLNQILINNCKRHSICDFIDSNEGINQLIINDPAELEKQGLTGLIELVDSLTGKTYQEVQEIARRIGEYSNV